MTSHNDPDQTTFEVVAIGWVRSSMVRLRDVPRQADEGAPPAVLELDPSWAAACDGLQVGDTLVVITWLHLADRAVTAVHPRDDPARQRTGVFATRSPDRPNPIGLHHATITAIEDTQIHVDALDTLDGTPVLDLKPRLGPPASR